MADDMSEDSVFDKVQEHQARDIIDESLKFQWRYTTLRNDYQDLKNIHEVNIRHSTERTEQLETQGYVFEVERRLHHYLSGLYTLLQQQNTLQNGVAQSFSRDLQAVKSEYMSKESSRTVLGLRHYIQHENVLPLKPRTSKLERTKSLVILVEDLHRQDGDKDFEQHFGHLPKPYFDPVKWVKDDWPDVEQFFQDSVEVILEQTEDEIDKLQHLRGEVAELYEEVADDYREFHSESD